jgi:hypothetical protein
VVLGPEFTGAGQAMPIGSAVGAISRASSAGGSSPESLKAAPSR